jgi:hypothetical protein
VLFNAFSIFDPIGCVMVLVILNQIFRAVHR